MSAALAKVESSAPVVTSEQLDLVKRTVAQGATDAELKLYLFDCARQGVHPLDRLLHFTKRGGKYTPITSIDFMRIRAAETNDYAGSDDAQFSGEPGDPEFKAVVAVWRLVQGQKCAFTATARWSEYCPPSGQDHMWRKMPHTMLAKCAEALALRKGFPRQLAGLYAKEEMDQAGGNGYSVQAPEPTKAATAAVVETRAPSVPNGGDSGRSVTTNNYATTENTAPRPELPEGCVRIERIDSSPTKNKNVTKYFVTLSTGEQLTTIKTQLASLCEQLCQENAIVTVETQQTKWGTDLIAVQRVEAPTGHTGHPTGDNLDEPPMLTDDQIPF